MLPVTFFMRQFEGRNTIDNSMLLCEKYTTDGGGKPFFGMHNGLNRKGETN
jgi:hypothetical protein